MKSMQFLKGIGVGFVVGSAIGMTTAPARKHGKSKFGKTIKNVGEVIETITDAIMM